ncbi:MAG: dihydrolipoamide acetyltransferase family protein, partial [Lutibacter sp.]|nr:dihydrolipoamide acetyltransferase family protein [Lutibacter sp.]
MAEIITMPRLSDTMTEGVVAQWLKKVGDKISEGDILAEIETDKATMEFESFSEGTLLYIGLKDGESAPVDSLLAIIGEEGEDIDAILKEFKAATPGASKAPETTKTPEAPKAPEKSAEIAEPVKVAETAQVPVSANASGRIIASPLAKKIASEKGINLNTVSGTGEGGRIVKSDVENYVPAAVSAVATVAAPIVSGTESFEETPNSQMRKTIARRLAESKFTAPHYYLMLEINMDNAIESRRIINELPDTKVSFNDMVVKASAMALKKHPKVNSQWFDDRTRINHHVKIGVAVAVEYGLVVPVT